MNSKIRLNLPSLALAFILVLTACAPQAVPTSAPVQPTATPEPTAELIVFTDGLDRTVTLESTPQRIVSMAPSITESLYAIGAGDQVVGRDEFSNYPPEVTDLPNIGGFFSDFNFEAVVDLEPDLVLAAEINTPEQVQTLEDLGLTVFLLANPTTIDEMYDSLRTLAQLTGHQQETESLVESLQVRVAAIEDKVSEAESQPKVFYEIDSTDPNKPYTAGSGTFITQLIEDAGGENIAADLEDPYPQVSIEELLIRDPDIILLGDAAYGVTAESLAGRTGWEALSAVQNGAIYPFNDDLASRPGPRLVDGLEQLAKLLHPELFE